MIGLITDTHYGVRNDHHALLDHQKQFTDELFLPYLRDNQIKTVIHLGDLVDRRKYTNHHTAHRLRQDFLDPLKEMGVTLHLIAGNHDTHFKNTNEVNAFQMLGLDREPWIQCYTEAEHTRIEGLPILLLPWICEDNHQNSMKAIQESTAEVCVGHLDLMGFERTTGNINDTGLDMGMFKKFKMVLSGHFHGRQTNGNTTYLGSPWETTWADFKGQRGFHTLDPKSLSLTFLANPRSLFHRIEYDDQNLGEYDFRGTLPLALPAYKGGYVRVVVKSRTKPETLDRLLADLEALPVVDVQVIDESLLSTQVRNAAIDQAESTLDILKKTVQELDIYNKTQVNDLLAALYSEASLIQS